MSSGARDGNHLRAQNPLRVDSWAGTARTRGYSSQVAIKLKR